MSTGTATEVMICGKKIRLGDHVKVRYKRGTWPYGGIIEGCITELWSPGLDHHLQARVNDGWCFHNCDEIISWTPKEEA